MEPTIFVIAEHADGTINPVTYEAVSFAVELEKFGCGKPAILIVGDEIGDVAQHTADTTGLDVLAIQVPDLFRYNSFIYKEVLGTVLKKLSPAFICAVHTTQGADFAPSLAVKLNAACITSVEGIHEHDGMIAFNRSIMGSKLQAQVQPMTDNTVVTIQPGMFSRTPQRSGQGVVETKTIAFSCDRIRPLGIKAGPGGASKLPEAKVIVAAGRGISQKEHLDLIFDLARYLPQSAVGSSRPLCDMGWLEYNHQVGLTGVTVSPELYMAIGISGAQQHIVGMQGSGLVVAINTDPHAAIFNHADICIIEDMELFLPELTKQLKALRDPTE
jgi:electron transfer flavoprotein alpha subunit